VWLFYQDINFSLILAVFIFVFFYFSSSRHKKYGNWKGVRNLQRFLFVAAAASHPISLIFFTFLPTTVSLSGLACHSQSKSALEHEQVLEIPCYVPAIKPFALNIWNGLSCHVSCGIFLFPLKKKT